MLPPPNHHIIHLPVTPAIAAEESLALNPSKISQQWLRTLEGCLANGGSQLSRVFHEDSWWRDMLGLDWEFNTIRGLSRIQTFVGKFQPRAKLSTFRLQEQGKGKPEIDTPMESLTWITGMFDFETRHGRGYGVFYLTQEETGSGWKAYSVYTCLQELKDFEEPLGPRRGEGTIYSMPGGFSGGTWIERLRRQVEFVNEDPTVLVIGAGE